MREVAELLFELGSEDRLRILDATNKKKMKLSELALTLSSTIQEISRQCGRLEAAGLIQKHPDATYAPTPVGSIALSLLPSFRLLQIERS